MFVYHILSYPVGHLKKVTEIENLGKQCCQMYLKGDKKQSYVYWILKPNIRVSSPSQSIGEGLTQA